MSSIEQKRPRGTSLLTSESLNSGVVRDSISGVSTPPGQTVFTVMRESASSQARCWLRPATPCLEAVYSALPKKAIRIPAVEAMFTMRPPPCFIICGMTAWQQRNTPLRFTPSTRSHCSSGMSLSRHGWRFDPGVVHQDVDGPELR